ncbi:MAG: hypothetical protein HQK52_19465 [Oligoflexia bacterium]|nr:hypothetical protein [Oligoflexia bacterium]
MTPREVFTAIKYIGKRTNQLIALNASFHGIQLSIDENAGKYEDESAVSSLPDELKEMQKQALQEAMERKRKEFMA